MNDMRLFDLVRYCRAMLYDDGLISDEEYAWLAVEGNGSAERLATYDMMRKELKNLKGERDAA